MTMITPSHYQFDFAKPISRDPFIDLLNAAYIVKSYRFCRQAALVWLTTYPGDLLINLFLAKSFSLEGKSSQAIPILTKLTTLDPEFNEASQELSLLNTTPLVENNSKTTGQTLDNTNSYPHSPYEWTRHIASSKQALISGDIETAEEFAHKALAANPNSPLPALQHIRIAHATANPLTVQNLSLVYHERWPECLQFNLLLADSFIKNGKESQGVALLNQCASQDNAGQVARRIWGEEFPYSPLWPADMSTKFDMPIPANVAAFMGWNQLASGENEMENNTDHQESPIEVDNNQNHLSQTSKEDLVPVDQLSSNSKKSSNNNGSDISKTDLPQPGNIQDEQKQDESLNQIHREFERIAKQLKTPGYIHADGRFPIYVIFSTYQGLIGQYGAQTTSILLDCMKGIASEIHQHHGWGASIFLPDSPEYTAPFNMQPISAIDPWKLKLSLVDLDRSLAKQGSMIGALLIVGGPKIIPFHQLPNPTIDNDTEIASDNPYATLDENYFIPEWPVGRIPGGEGSDVGLLLAQLRKVLNYHAKLNKNQPKRCANRIINTIIKPFKAIFGASRKMRFSYGYTAEVWHQSSKSVFRSIGKASSLLSSPPTTSGTLNKKLLPSYLGYFNLHGIKDGAEWYGQKNSDSHTKWPEYPVALSPSDIANGKAPEIVFSEACYGTYIDGKEANQALSLTFLQKGSLAMVGSTVTSYGSVTNPLIAADLLGYYFWHFIRQGYWVGNALLKAKWSLASEMSKRQGFLDGEDQKTLLSYILYGDPLVNIQGFKLASKIMNRSKIRPSVNTVSDYSEGTPSTEKIPNEALIQVKQMVKRYLPELQEADLVINHQRYKGNPIESKGRIRKAIQISTDRMVLTLSKQIQSSNKVHTHYARFTLNAQGKILKFSASR